VRALGPAKGGGYLWELRWDAHPFPTGQVRVVLLPRSLLPAVVSGSCMRTARDQ
jgi:hypothetical protein